MHGRQPRFRPRHGGGGRPLPAQPQVSLFNDFQNPNIYFQNLSLLSPLNPYIQNPNFSIQNPNFPIQNPAFSPHQFPNQVFHFQSSRPSEVLERIERAVAKARSDLLIAGESVSAWKVSQSALLTLQADSWDSLGFQLQQVPSLHRLIVIEGKINAFIHCFVGVRRITSLYELEVAICENEGIDRFEELELGPLVRHPLIGHYFSVSSDVTEVYKITSAEIISFLPEFMNSLKGKEVKADEFLDFLTKKLSVTKKEKLSVRVQSLRLYITYLWKARKRETDTRKKCLKGLKQKSDQKNSKYPQVSSQKKQLDGRFSAILQRIKSFSSGDQDFGGKHIRFISSSSESDDSNSSEHEDNKDEKDEQIYSKFSLQKSNSCDRVSSCPYPSVSEEMTRLGLNIEMDGNHTTTSGGQMQSKKKRKSENVSCDISAPHKLLKRDRVEPHLPSNDGELKESGNQNETDHLLLDSSMELFITTWKDACREHNVTEVFDRMLQFYGITPRRRKRMKSMFSSFPYAGLLNVAVTSIKCGMWNSMYDTFQALGPHEIEDALSKKYAEYESIEIEPDAKEAPVITEHVVKHNCSVTIEDIVKKVSTYFELDVIPNDVGTHLEKQFILLRKLCKCELWLTEQFSVKEFESLGYGEFPLFLEKHVPILPNVLQKCLTGGTCEKSCLEVCMLPQQLSLLLSQGSNSLWENKNISRQSISELLMRQFPSISFKLVESGSVEDFLDDMRENKSGAIPKCVLFSATLLEMCCTGDSSCKEVVDLSSIAEMRIGIGHKAGTSPPVTTKDAIEALLMAPMLSDLGSWSHWDLKFRPSLGPLVEWLLNEVNTKELLCLVTKDGKAVRIDHAASIDSFLEACLQGSSFQTAVELLSLLSLYGGQRHVPLSLLKCHARRALEVLTKNYTEIEASDGQNVLIHGNPVYRLQMLNKGASCNFSSELNKSKNMVISGVPVASRFILDCLGHLPAEFRSFAADVLLSGLQSVIRDAPSAILCECKQIEQRVMLHELGLSLGIMEWISDYHVFCSSMASDFLLSTSNSCIKAVSSELSQGSICVQGTLNKFTSYEGEIRFSVPLGQHKLKHTDASLTTCMVNNVEVCTDPYGNDRIPHLSKVDKDKEAAMVIESIRCQEFGLDPSLSDMDGSMLKKQHARLGRALHCLSQELYSQDSHFLLELVQNADDNVYPDNVEPTLTFILQEAGIIVLNNEQGFSVENIRALCDVGNSTKKGPDAGYIGKKGIGFKSVFRVTDAPEIHSNGFHVKFDISQGQIGFVLPTVVPPCDIDLFGRLLSDQVDTNSWNTCIVLPFRSKLSERFSMNNIVSMFSDLHPSLLLFLHHLQCIKFRNMLDDSLIVMRREIMGDGITKVSLGKDKMTWFVASQKLQSGAIRPDVQTTEISIAFTLEESDNGDYLPHLDQQPVFAFLPLRKYGLKFILQGDFVLPSSREEVDGNSPWNQWLLSQFPELFVNAERSFCALSCYRENPGKAVAAFMSFVPLVGEVHGFFSSLPRMIISKLRMSNCLLLEGNKNEWVPPCKVLRSWNEQARTLLPDSLLLEHLGLGFLDRDIVLSDSLARALGIEEYGPKILLQIISSLCTMENGLESVGLIWLSSWLNTLYTMLFHSSVRTSLKPGTESDLISNLKKIPFIPLSDGTYGSINEGMIWLSSDGLSNGFDNEYGADAFPKLYAKLRTVSHALFSAAAAVDVSFYEDVSIVDNITRMLYRIGIQRLSSHEILKLHILPAISDERMMVVDKNLMIEYLSFAMFHLQSSCPNCDSEREYIFSELYGKALILTNHGYKRPAEVSIHFNKVYGNPIDVNKLIDSMDLKWHEVDVCYLNHPITELISSGVMKWRKFFQELGITDFVHVVSIVRSITDISHVCKNMVWDIDLISPDPVVKDWESQELVHLLSELSNRGDRVRSMYLLEVFDILWDDCFCDKVTGSCNFKSVRDSRQFKSSFVRSIQDIRWIASSMDDELHYPRDLFCDCDAVRSILGATAPYAEPKIRSEKLLSDIGFKTQVSLNDILAVLQVWRRLETPFKASIAQMSKFYTSLWNEMATSKLKIIEELCAGPFVFVPHSCGSRNDDVVLGELLSPQEVYWQDPTGSVDQMKEIHPCNGSELTYGPVNKTLCNIYPSLHDFFVQDCGIDEIPSFRSYLQILQQLSSITLPSQSAHMVFQIFLKWSDGLKSALLGSEDFVHLKESLLGLEYTVLPVVQDKWVSLHPSFGIVCWCDDEKLKKEFKHFGNIDFLYFGELTDSEKEMLQAKVSVVMQTLGIPALSEIVNREAIYYGPAESTFTTSLVNWALPYAQRYILNVHPDKYFQFKQSGFEKLNRLQIVVVEKLFYRNIIKNSAIASKKRVECSCLLQGNVLYTTRESDSHSIFMELSHLLFDGTPELHLANFLHMITTMAESGSTEEQTEFFILNSQKMPKLPDGESVWALSSVVSLTENDQASLTNCGSTMVNEQNSSKSKKKPGISSSWPPVDWKTAPGFSFARAKGSQPSSSVQTRVEEDSYNIVAKIDRATQLNTDWTIKEDPVLVTTTVWEQDSATLEDQSYEACGLVASDKDVFDSIDLVTPSNGPDLGSSKYSERVQLSFGTPSAQQALLTGRLGEFVAFNYFVTNVGKTIVKWVNEERETGLPYDLVIGEGETSTEYIEVKTTKSARKDWFSISVKEWQFAVEKGESFSIARVVLLGNNMARITVFKNPVRLSQLGKLQLAVMIPKQLKEFSRVS